MWSAQAAMRESRRGRMLEFPVSASAWHVTRRLPWTTLKSRSLQLTPTKDRTFLGNAFTGFIPKGMFDFGTHRISMPVCVATNAMGTYHGKRLPFDRRT